MPTYAVPMAIRRIIGCSAALLLSAAGAGVRAQADHAAHHAATEGPAMLRTPESIHHEHAELHETLGRAASEAGALGETARKLEAALAPHFRREEEIATPPLGLLPAIAAGEPVDGMIDVLPMTDALERELPQMLAEHGRIRAALAEFQAAAEAAGREEYVRFAEGLAAHARQEEDVLYPAAILVGRYVRATTSDL